jgi:outer membrane protein
MGLPIPIFIVLLITTIVPLSAHAENSSSIGEIKMQGASLSFEEAVRRGLVRHPLIRISEHEVAQIEAVTKQLEAANYPRVTGVFANSAGDTRVLANLGISGSLPKPTNYLTTPGLRVDLLITDFGHTAHKILANKAVAASAQKNVLTTKAVVILTIEQAYLNCLKQQRFVDIAREVLKERELIRAQTESLYRNQLRSKLDVDFASVEANRAELAVIKSQNALKTAFADLDYAMGQQGPHEYALATVPLAIKPLPPLPELFEQALLKRPELLGSQDRIHATAEALKAARALNFGSVTAIGTGAYTWWGHEERPSGKEVGNPGAQLGWWGAGGTSSFPIYTGGRIQGQIDEAEARKGEMAANARTIANDVILQVARAYLSQTTAAQQITVDEERVAQSRDALTLARERYKNSLGSILDVTTATMNLLQAEVGLAESQYNYRLSEAAVAYATGTAYARF